MSDFDNLQLLKKMLEGAKPHETEAEAAAARERRFISDVTKACTANASTGNNGIQTYKPEQAIDFIRESGSSLQAKLGGEWLEMDTMAFDALAYTVLQKMQKSASLLDWNS